MFDDHAVMAFFKQRMPDLALQPSTLLADVLDSLTFLDFFLFLEQALDDTLTLDQVAQCATVGELVSLLDTAACPPK
ncbi:hypothetical protein [Rugamonas aquatica]|uniref:Acyl carrier protein n=1 Tax=Rugamonas aquatica TaxID=2743357 RepID=A0A6A7N5N0_9BURK|nr:hypothetical protein [Rugamonas aquatica]MQA40383.1 hypothetical protein [Rugamonas aquatica]